MIKEYLEERKEILSNIIRKNKEKYEHNQIAITESNNQIKELNETIDEASQIFSVKAREDNGFKNQEIGELKSRIAAYVVENNEYKNNMDKAQEELSVVKKCFEEINSYETYSKKEDVSRETSENDLVKDNFKGKQLDFVNVIEKINIDAKNKEIIDKLEFCKSIVEIDGKRVNIELDNLINMLK